MKLSLSILFFAAVIIVQNVSAQTLDVFGGINFSGMKHKFNGETQESNMSTGFQVGLGVVLPLNKAYYKNRDDDQMTGIYPSLQYITKGIKKTTLVGPINSDIKLNYLQFTVPFYTRTGDYGIGLGPYAALATSGKLKYTSITGGDRGVNFGSGATNDLKGVDYGLSLTMSISIFYLQYDYGFANLGAGTFGSAKSRNFSVGLLIPLVNRYD